MDTSKYHSPSGILANIRNDLLPSVVVFLVALPLCLGIAIASGAPPVTGLITGIIGGIVVGFLAGSPLQVSGPAAGLTVIVYDLFQRFDPTVVFLIVLLAGIMQIAAGAMKLGQWFRAVSPAVVQGMLAGIGVLIFASQFHIMADDKPREGMELFGFHLHAGLANLLTIPETIYRIFIPMDGSTHQWAAGLGVLTISIIVAWKLFAPKKLKLIPGPLLGVVVATAIVMIAGVNVQQLSERIPDNLFAGLTFPDLSVWLSAPLAGVIIAAAGVALVASAETLLCATAVDQMHQGVRTKYDRELMAQGVGNTLCGLLGGLPMTGVIVRSAANIESGAKSRASAMMHGTWLLLVVALLPFVLKQIPVSALAAVLVYTGYKLVNPKAIKELWKFGKSEVFIYFATLVTIVCTDLLVGVATGIVLAALKLLYTFSHLDVTVENEPAKNRTTMILDGTATFVRLPKLAAALDKVPEDAELHVQFGKLAYIDHACLDLLMNWEKQHEATGGSLVLDWDSLTAKFKGTNRTDDSIAATAGNGHASDKQAKQRSTRKLETAGAKSSSEGE